MKQLEKIKTEIKRLSNLSSEGRLVPENFIEITSILESLEKEQPQGLDEAAEGYSKCYAHCFSGNSLDDAIYLAFKAGARWMAEQGNDNLPKVHGWVARDAFGDTICIYSHKPYRPSESIGVWHTIGGSVMRIDKNLLPGLKCEDEPIEVELTIKRKEDSK